MKAKSKIISLPAMCLLICGIYTSCMLDKPRVGTNRNRESTSKDDIKLPKSAAKADSESQVDFLIQGPPPEPPSTAHAPRAFTPEE